MVENRMNFHGLEEDGRERLDDILEELAQEKVERKLARAL